ncbi:MAG: TolC family protein [Vicinamibacterales bacterium]
MRHVVTRARTPVFAIAALLLCGVGRSHAQADVSPPLDPDAPLTLAAALGEARRHNVDVRGAETRVQLAVEDRRQARAGLLPSVSGLLQQIYTQPNGTSSGVFVSNDGPRIYNAWGTVHGDIFSPARWAEYRARLAAEAAERARADVERRGLVAAVVSRYYALVAAERRVVNAEQGVREARQFLTITDAQERGGEAAHADVVKAELQVAARERDVQETTLEVRRSRLELSIAVFAEDRERLAVVDDLTDAAELPALATVRARASDGNPLLKAAESVVRQETSNVAAARSDYFPTVSFDYWYGINANEFAIDSRLGTHLLGSVWQTQLTVPLWNWGATQSRVRQARLRAEQARVELRATERALDGHVALFHAEARVARDQLASLRRSLDLAGESLRLTLLRYQAGEVSVLEVVDAQSTLIQARNAHDDGLVRYKVALAAIQTLTGTL